MARMTSSTLTVVKVARSGVAHGVNIVGAAVAVAARTPEIFESMTRATKKDSRLFVINVAQHVVEIFLLTLFQSSALLFKPTAGRCSLATTSRMVQVVRGRVAPEFSRLSII